MILEVANLNLRPGESVDFERAFVEAQVIIAGDKVSTNRQRTHAVQCSPSTDACARHQQREYHHDPRVATLNIRPGASADFERAFAEAQAIIAAMARYGWGAQRIIETN
jgi:hypothetical protein